MPKKNNKKALTIYLPEHLRTWVEYQAKMAMISQTAVVAQLVAKAAQEKANV